MIYILIEFSEHDDCCASWQEVEKVQAFKTLEAAKQFLLTEGAKEEKDGNFTITRLKGKYKWIHTFEVMELPLQE